MNSYIVEAIVRKDLKVVFQNKGVSVPLIMAPVIMLALVPLMALAATSGEMSSADSAQFVKLFEMMPPGLLAALAGYDGVQKYALFLLVYGGAVLYTLLPLLVVTTVASDSFAGEKERKTLEALLYTPSTDWELLLGKLLSAWLPALGISWGGFVLYSMLANLAAWPVMGKVFFPTTTWVILAGWVAPAAAGLALGAMVLISSRARTFQSANQLAAVAVLPIFAMLGSSLFMVMCSGPWLMALLGLALWAIDAALVWLGRRSFRRTRLATQI